MAALKPHKIPKEDLKNVQRIFDTVHEREDRYELNLYITGADEETEAAKEPNYQAVDGEADDEADETSALEAREPITGGQVCRGACAVTCNSTVLALAQKKCLQICVRLPLPYSLPPSHCHASKLRASLVV